MPEYQKVKSVAKNVQSKGPALNKIILDTMAEISAIVGATLGPGGQPVLIEREDDLPAAITKDGVTVYRALGFQNPIAHAILETARDASIRTASEAGDGTTTATVLSEAIVRNTLQFTKDNPRLSPQRVISGLRATFDKVIEPLIKSSAVRVDSTSPEGRALMRSVAKTSANGDESLADAVLEAFAITGDEGNVTIVEASGPSGYEVEHLSGFPIPMGYEDSMNRFYSRFINDHANQRILLDNPVFILYDGKVTEIQTVLPALEKIAQAYTTLKFNHNVVLVAHGFSESVLGNLAIIYDQPNNLKIVPMLTPMSAQLNGQTQFLHDLAAVTGARVFDGLTNPLDSAQLETDFGPVVDESTEEGPRLRSYGPHHLEMGRFRSTLVGIPEDEATSERLVERVEALRQAKSHEGVSQLDATLIQERIAKLTGGIARLKCLGASGGELREKRDRADDAVCAVRGALKHGALPGGAWTLQFVAAAIEQIDDPSGALKGILIPSLREPLVRILENAGWSSDEIDSGVKVVTDSAGTLLKLSDESLTSAVIVDTTSGEVINAFDRGVVDATPAVLEALRNSLSIASLLGTLGGTIVYPRDGQLEREEAARAQSFNRMANVSAADERA